MNEQKNDVEILQENTTETQAQGLLKLKQFISEHKVLSSIIGFIVGFIFVILLSLMIGSESSAKENIVGHTYSGTDVSNGLVMRTTIVFNMDYSFDMYIEVPYEEESYTVVGAYEIDGNNVKLIVKSGNNPIYTYDESNKSLSNGNIVLYQTSN